ncbi:MAG: Gfo/Idh/MocA family oxidoreductase, partial [Chloroflexi bacterium]|nr:Gfo/Idh/MocA family oxidoreductase [Chloroflexota bacterium]
MVNRKFAVVGCGSWGKNLVRNFCALLGTESVVCCDQNVDALRQMESQCPGVSVVADMERILSDDSVYAVAIATPTPTHFALALDALSSGKHVLVEKPLATSVAEASALCAAAERNSRVLMVDHVLLFHPAVREMIERIHAGALGDVFMAYSRRTNLGIVRS